MQALILTPLSKNFKFQISNLNPQPLPLPSFHKLTGVVTCGKLKQARFSTGYLVNVKKTDLK